MSEQQNNDVNMLDASKYFYIQGMVCNVRERTYNDTVTKYLMIEDASNAEWPNYFEVEFYKDKAEMVKDVEVGDMIKANINFGGRKWEDKSTHEVKGAFFSLKGWKVEVTKSGQPNQVPMAPVAGEPMPDYNKQDLEESCPF